MKIIVENKIPFIESRLDALGEVVRLAPAEITPEAVSDADALVVRTRTRCDASLLDGSKVKTVATATIGTDHIDLEYCRAHGIRAVNAPGCNAPAVAQWVFAAIAALAPDGFYHTPTLGIIGVGHVGSIVERWAEALGFRVLHSDPPRAARERDFVGTPIEKLVAEADFITVHTPLDGSTHHLLGRELFPLAKRGACILNAARGPVTDTAALLAERRRLGGMAIDCWEGEPQICRPLMDAALIATPHIAGYSLQGKQRAADAVVHALLHPELPILEPQAPPAPQSLSQIADSYPIMADSDAFKSAPEAMESLRNNYPLRNEFGFH